MPSLRSLTDKIKTKFSPSSSASASSATSPTSFEVVSGARKSVYEGGHAIKIVAQNSDYKGDLKDVAKAHRRMDSFLDENDGVSMPAQVMLRDRVVAAEDKKLKRRSRFREEFGCDK